MDKVNVLIVAAIVLVLSLMTTYAVAADGLECPICNVDLGGYTGELDESEIEGLLLALNDEYHAWAVYDQVLEDFGDVRPFSSIQASEATHIEALVELFEAYDVPVPENPWVGNVPSFESVEVAAATGVQAEVDNVALYDVINSSTEREDILEVYASLQRASEENHLPAFQRVVDRGTGTGDQSGQGGQGNSGGRGRGGNAQRNQNESDLAQGSGTQEGRGRGGNAPRNQNESDLAQGQRDGVESDASCDHDGSAGQEDGVLNQRGSSVGGGEGASQSQSLWERVRGWFSRNR